MDVKIFVVTQKKVFDLPIGGGYYWIQSGAALGKLIPGIVHDNDSDDNRSKKNPLYSEYSAHYYIWKNTNSDVVGISHYRRFFDNGSFFIKPIEQNHIELLIKKSDVILPFRRNLGDIKKQYIACHCEKDWDIFLNVLSSYDNDFYKYFIKYIKNHRELSVANMFICRRSVADEYWSWIFPLFDLVEPKLDINNKDQYQMRVIGYLAERVLEPWMIFHNYRILYRFVYNTEMERNWLRRFKELVKQILRKLGLLQIYQKFSNPFNSIEG